MKSQPADNQAPLKWGETQAADRWREYSRQKMEWIEEHPYATPREIEEACVVIAAWLGV